MYWFLLTLLVVQPVSLAKSLSAATKHRYKGVVNTSNKYQDSDTDAQVLDDSDLEADEIGNSEDDADSTVDQKQYNPGRFLYASTPRFTKFTPQDDCTGTYVHFINHTHGKIYVLAYAFTCPHIIRALADAAKRGVKVRVLVDKQYENKPHSSTLRADPKVKMYADRTPAIAHNKIMLFSNRGVSKSVKQFDVAVITGSFNFSASAQKRNAENIDGSVNDFEKYAAHKKNWKYRKRLPLTVLLTASAIDKPCVGYAPRVVRKLKLSGYKIRRITHKARNHKVRVVL